MGSDLKLAGKDKENRRLEDYINKIEARNNELQQTIRTLKRIISLLEPCNIKQNYSIGRKYIKL